MKIKSAALPIVSESDLETFGSGTKAFISAATKPRLLINYTTPLYKCNTVYVSVGTVHSKSVRSKQLDERNQNLNIFVLVVDIIRNI